MIQFDIKAWRNSMGLSQREAAERLDVNLKTYQEWERGFRFATERRVIIDRRTVLACLAIRAGLDEGLDD